MSTTTADRVVLEKDLDAQNNYNLGATVLWKLCRNATDSSIAKGTPVYITGNTGDEINIAPADNTDPAKMPASGITIATIAAGGSGEVVVGGLARNINVGGGSVGQTLYVDGAGTFTTTKPSYPALIQNIGTIVKSGAAGTILVFGPGRSNNVPALDDGTVFIGDSSGNVVQRKLVQADIDDMQATDSVTFATLTTSNGNFSTAGDACAKRVVLRIKTTDDTATELFVDGTSSRLAIPADTTWLLDIRIVAQSSANADRAIYHRRCCLTNAAGTTALEGAVQTVGTDIESDAAWDVAVSANDTNDALKIEVEGASGTDIRWVACVDLVQVTYP